MNNLQEWLELRKTGIGGSDAAAIANLNKYKTPMRVYQEKLGLVEPVEESDAMSLGHRLEPVIRAMYAEKFGINGMGLSMTRKDNEIVRSPQYDFVIGSFDGLVFDDKKGVAVWGFEAKATSGYPKGEWGESGSDHVPPAYYLQCQHYMLVTGLQRWDLAALIGSTKFYIYHIFRNEQVITDLLKLEMNFWNNHVLAQVPPEIDGSDAATEYLKNRFPVSDAYTIEADRPMIQAMEKWYAIDAKIDELEQEKQLVQNQIIATMGDAEKMIGGDYVCNFKSRKAATRIDWQGISKKLAGGSVPEEVVIEFTKENKPARPFTIEYDGESNE